MGRIRRAAGRLSHAVGAAAGGVLQLWRRSLQFRITTTTLLVCGVIVLVLGFVLIKQITDGLLESKVNSAIDAVESGQRSAAAQLGTLGGSGDPELQSTVLEIDELLSARTGTTGEFGVLLKPGDTDVAAASSRFLDGINVQIPPGLEHEVVDNNNLTYQYTRLTAKLDGSSAPYLVVGTPVVTDSGSFALYYYFPLGDLQQTVSLVQNAVLAIGGLLVLLVVGLAALVTRQVVQPVRVAARTAERLSAGLLAERMQIDGEDDLARLATSFNQMAVNLQQQILALEDLSRLQRQFTSDVSHELRTPLTTIRMAAEVLHDGRAGFDEQTRRSAELLYNEVDRFELLLADLLEISRYDAGFAVLEAEPHDLRQLVNRAVGTIAPLAARAGSVLRIDLPRQPAIADVDARRVERVLRNLLGNAVEHGEGRPVVIAMAQDAHAVAVTVRDNGVGLAPKDAETVFERFWRADPSRARQTGGTGLGLSIALEDAHLHGGWLEATGQLGVGAVFRLTLPLRAGEDLRSSPLPLEMTDQATEVARG
ncbi:MtrAB system histidine kinase MtrB [Fodinicola acaciae]|uniref:MtrAB system histidine kinase MtrB n=1 Tax=Fodinicola acaciae TaxID=2681555 RepID=UPI0013D32B7A|nr:MtrAB system histidine kinase MtrB [Fodinicola acaciae]